MGRERSGSWRCSTRSRQVNKHQTIRMTTSSPWTWPRRRFHRGPACLGPVISGTGCGTTKPKLTLLWGGLLGQGSWTAEDFGNGNNHSVVVRVDYGKSSMLITGDLEERGIKDLLARNAGSGILDVGGYVVGHHGSYNATSVELLQAMTPEWAVIEVGPSTRKASKTAYSYGHPRNSVVTDLLAGVSGTRPTVYKPAATGQYKFVSRKITKAVYATGWDGSFVMEGSASGAWRKLDPEVAAEGIDVAEAVTAKVNINTADVSELEKLPMIGPARARAIVASRQLGQFQSLQDLTRIRGIGNGTVRLLRRYATT